MRRVLGGVAVIALCAGTAVGASKTPVAATIELNMPVRSSAVAEGQIILWPALGDWVTFKVTFSKSLERTNPRILINCYQNGELVYGEAGPYYGAFMLGGSGSLWVYDQAPGDRQSGSRCVATLFYWSHNGGQQKWNYLAETQFDAAGAP